MSKLNPQNATAYVGPGVLKRGGNITPVPNGPLIKKKGPFKGSTLKNGGNTNSLKNKKMATMKKAKCGTKMKKAQEGVVVSTKDEKANSSDFTYLKPAEKTASAAALKSKVKPKEMISKPKVKAKVKAKCGTKMTKK